MNAKNTTAGGSLGGDHRGRRQIAVHVIAAALLVVFARSVHLAFAAEGEQPDTRVEQESPRSPFELFDRHGQALALSVECFDLSVSPRSLWRSHTPDHLADVMGATLGMEAEALLLRLLPEGIDPTTGFVFAEEPRLLRFDANEVSVVQEWLREGGLGEKATGEPLLGWHWRVLPGKQYATLAWNPVVVLGRTEREKHLGQQGAGRPDRWTRKLLSDLSQLVTQCGLPPECEEDMRRMAPFEKRAYLADAIWTELCPTTYRVVQRGVAPHQAHALAQLLRDETVSPWQVQLKPSMERFQPVRARGAGMSPIGESEGLAEDSFAVLGHWGVLGAEDARYQAEVERETAPHLLPWHKPGDPIQARAEELANEWRPWSGLERLCASLLDQSGLDREWSLRGRGSAVHARRVARDRRLRWPDRIVPDTLQDVHAADPQVELHSTLDAELQHALHAELLDVMGLFDPALAMGICIEVETGRVLAVDGVCAYPGSRFLPTQHVFTPGSTFKALIMAAALERGLVEPEEHFETFHPKGITVRHGRSRRNITEAEGAPDAPLISATWGLAKSVNAVLVQVGLRLRADDLRAWLVALGYGERPNIGIGPERKGYLPRLKKGTWSRVHTHASVCFGHEIGVTLWQHAQGLSALARNGYFRPLRLVDAVSQGSDWREFMTPDPRPVIDPKACEQVLAMLALGAERGTGRRVATKELNPEFYYLGTKTGTTEKVPTEMCIHVELEHAAQHESEGTSCSKACYKSMRGKRMHKGRRNTCYTSSMCAIGRLTADGPTLLTLVVVDDPRSKAKFGGDVAGRSAIRLLRLGFGLTEEFTEAKEPTLPQLATHAFGSLEMPWLEEGEVNWPDSWEEDSREE